MSSRPSVEAVELELDALEERAVGVVGVLLEVDDVAAVRGDERRHRGDDAAAVGAGDEQHGVGHRAAYRWHGGTGCAMGR